MLFPGWIYIARGPSYFGNFYNIFLPNMGEDQKKILLSQRVALALHDMVNPALVIPLRSQNG